QKIRREIRDCALFVAVISHNTEARTEGYFRLEWHLADQRTQLMAKSRPFLVPVCIDDTPERHAEVPESFAQVHWTRLPAGETPQFFVERMQKLLLAEHSPAPAVAAAPPGAADRAPRHRRELRWTGLAAAIALVVAGAVWLAA